MGNVKKAFSIAAGILITLIFLGILVIQWGPFQEYLAKRIVKFATEQTGWYVDFKLVKWLPFSEAQITSLVVYAHGKQVVSARKVTFSYELSFKKPFIVPRKVLIDKPLVVGELDEAGRIVNFPEGSGKTTSEKKPLINFPSPDVEIENGRIVAIKDGVVVASLKDVSTRAKIAVSPGENKIQVKVSDGSFFAEKPLLETLRWSGVVTVSKDGIILRSFSAFSKHWGVLVGSGYWDLITKRGFFRFSIQDLTLSTISAVTTPFVRYLGTTSYDGEVTITPSSIEMDYNVRDSKAGQINGVLAIKLGERLRIDNRANFSLSSSFETSYFALKGRFTTSLEVASGKDIAGYGDISLDSSEIGAGPSTFVFINRGVIKWKFSDRSLELEKIDIVGSFGELVARADLQRDHGLKALLEWKIIANQGENFGNGYQTRSLNAFLAKNEIPINRSSGILNVRCGDLLCRDIRSIRTSGKVIFVSPGTTFLAEGNLSKDTVALLVQGKTDRLSEWAPLLGISSSVSGLVEFNGTFSGSIDYVGFQLKSVLTDGRVGSFIVKRLAYESRGRIQSCRSATTSRCQGIDIGNVIYVVDHNGQVIFDKIQKQGNNRFFSGLLTIFQEKSNARVSGNVKSGDGAYSGNFVAHIENIWKRPLFSVADSKFTFPGLESLTLNMRGTFTDSEGVSIESFKISKADQVINGSLNISKSGNIKGRVKADNLAIFEQFLASKGIKLSGGQIGGELLIDGSLERPALLASIGVKPGSLLWEKGTHSRFSWNRFVVESRLDRGTMSGKILVESPEVSKPLQIQGTIPVQLSLHPFSFSVPKNKPISGVVDLSEMNFAHVVLWFLHAERVQGAFSLHARFSGTIANPKVEGEGVIREGEIELKKGYVLSNIDGLFKFEPQGINIVKLTTKGFGGEAFLQGVIPYSNWQQLTISGVCKDVVVPRFYGITGRGSGQAVLTIVQGHPFVEGNFKIAEASMDLGLLKDTLKKNIDVVSASDRSSSGLQGGTTLDFGLKLFLDLSEARAKVVGLGLHDEVVGKLWVVKNLGGKVGLEGKIEHRRGWFEFGDAKVEFSEGYALFKGSPDPDLFLVGNKKVGDIEITVKVIGKGSEPEVVMTSDPPLDRIDMVSYLLFNRPATGLTGGEGLTLETQAAAFLGSQASRILKKSIGDTPFTPDVVQMRGSDSGQSSVIEIGKYVTPDFYVTYEKDLRSSGGENFKVEYRLNRHMSIQSQIGSQNRSGVDVLWRYDFGK